MEDAKWTLEIQTDWFARFPLRHGLRHALNLVEYRRLVNGNCCMVYSLYISMSSHVLRWLLLATDDLKRI